ncbi:MAG: IS630 family transposase [Planctomycetes bacterium]|nr:IS630 family transposase [Planctomycetota bacterium]
MSWLRIALTEEELKIVRSARESHPDLVVRRRLQSLWLLNCGLTREKAVEILDVAVSTVKRDVKLYRTGGLDSKRRGSRGRPISHSVPWRGIARRSASLSNSSPYGPSRKRVCGLRNSPARIASPLKSVSSSKAWVCAIPLPPKKREGHVADQEQFLEQKLKPLLDAAQSGHGHVFFGDAAHYVFGTFLCSLWSFVRLHVRAASGRQRFNVLGSRNAVTRQLVAVTNMTVVNTQTMCELLHNIADLHLTGLITLVLDNARYQRNAVVMALAGQLGIQLQFLPSYSPNLNLIERLWKFLKCRSIYGPYHPTFADFRTAIETTISQIPTTHASDLASLMTLNFQQFENVSHMAA